MRILLTDLLAMLVVGGCAVVALVEGVKFFG
jgi:hypothetical protein